ncbi:MAG: adenine deaminase, partial [Erysipelotrichaceae bacterium]|nr:adenine deaminase [Erysipelotrichaceae bacterium]
MKTLLKNAQILNVFTESLQKVNLLIEDNQIAGMGDYTDEEVDNIVDYTGKFIVPGLIDGHVHIESTMLTPTALAGTALVHGTTAIVADPHEIANVCGIEGIEYMIRSSRGLPLKIYYTLPSCVPATPFDESGAVLNAEDLEVFYRYPEVVGLAEMMNYPGLLAGDPQIMKKIADATANDRVIDGHAPLLTGNDLDRYIKAGVYSDHETTSFFEAREKLEKGQWIMIREGSAAKNLDELIALFDEPYYQRCLLATDDRNPYDLLHEGHIDNIIRKAVGFGKPVIRAIKMASYNAAQRFKIPQIGAIAPGYTADIVVL